jgi:hypothetical protein
MSHLPRPWESSRGTLIEPEHGDPVLRLLSSRLSRALRRLPCQLASRRADVPQTRWEPSSTVLLGTMPVGAVEEART